MTGRVEGAAPEVCDYGGEVMFAGGHRAQECCNQQGAGREFSRPPSRPLFSSRGVVVCVVHMR